MLGAIHVPCFFMPGHIITCTFDFVRILLYFADNTGELVVTNDTENKDLLNTIHTLWPEMERYIKIDELYGRLHKYQLLSEKEMQLLRLPGKAEFQQNQDLLNFLGGKSPEGLENFIKMLYNTAHIEGHRHLITLLRDKGVYVGNSTTV